jgi:hypothetical protein
LIFWLHLFLQLGREIVILKDLANFDHTALGQRRPWPTRWPVPSTSPE